MSTIDEIAQKLSGLQGRLLAISNGDTQIAEELHAAREVFRQRGAAAIDALVNAIDDGVRVFSDELAAADEVFRLAIDSAAEQRKTELATAMSRPLVEAPIEGDPPPQVERRDEKEAA